MSAYGEIASFYDLLTGNVNYDAYSEYIAEKLKENNIEGLILDAGCGTGTLLSRIRAYGYDMIGVDICPEMLSVADAKQTGALLLQQDLSELDLYGTVSGAISTLDVINHFSSELLLKRFLSRLSLFMEEGGVFIFDLNLPYKHETVLADNTFVFDYGSCVLVWQNKLLGSRLLIEMDLFIEAENGSYIRKREKFWEYTYTPERIKALLEPDFEILEVLDGESFSALSETSERAVFAVRKRRVKK